MWNGYRCTILALVIMAGQVYHISGCLAPSFDRNKNIANCSADMPPCPRDSSHCHTDPRRRYGTCCLGCRSSIFEPQSSCMNSSDCKTSDRSRRFRCRKPRNNRKARGVCCESIGY